MGISALRSSSISLPKIPCQGKWTRFTQAKCHRYKPSLHLAKTSKQLQGRMAASARLLHLLCS